MKIQHKKKKVFIIALSIIAVIFMSSIVSYATTGTLFGWKFSNESIGVKTDGENPPSSEQLDNGVDIKEKSVKGNGSSGSDQPVDPKVQEDGRKLVELSITSINRIESLVRVSVMISSLDNEGVCTLIIKNSSGTTIYSATAQTQAQSNTSTCKGFDIPKSSLPSGNYVFNISYLNDSNYGTTEQKYVSE